MKTSSLNLFPRRRGSAIIEATMAVAIVAAALLSVMQLLAVVGQQRRDAEQRRTATREVANVMEQLLAQPWEDVTAERLAALELSADCRRVMPDARLRAEVADEAGPPGVKRIRVELDWLDRGGQRGEPARLVAWKFRSEEAAP